jgi:hypothetical protein
MNITNEIYMGAEAAMSNARTGVSRPNGVKRLSSYFVLHYCSLFCFTDDSRSWANLWCNLANGIINTPAAKFAGLHRSSWAVLH